MQQRISDTLLKMHTQAVCDNNIVQANHLKKQLSLIHSADITTIDATMISHNIALAAEESRRNGGKAVALEAE